MLFLCFLGSGILLIFLGVTGLSGQRRSWYIGTNIYSGGINFGSIPVGIGSILWAIAFLPSFPTDWRTLLILIGIGFGFVGVVFSIIQPSFLKPGWLRWLESKHGNIMPLLRREIREMGYQEWEEQTNVQEKLEQWVAEVRHKHGL